jgi:hypothetical protein
MSKGYKVEREVREARRHTTRAVERKHTLMNTESGEVQAVEYVAEVSAERAELALVVAEMSRAFKDAIDF